MALQRSWKGDKTEVITNKDGERATPSVVAYTKQGELLVGQTAKRQAVISPKKYFLFGKAFYQVKHRQN